VVKIIVVGEGAVGKSGICFQVIIPMLLMIPSDNNSICGTYFSRGIWYFPFILFFMISHIFIDPTIEVCETIYVISNILRFVQDCFRQYHTFTDVTIATDVYDTSGQEEFSPLREALIMFSFQFS